jgi:hypothetical protein
MNNKRKIKKKKEVNSGQLDYTQRANQDGTHLPGWFPSSD